MRIKRGVISHRKHKKVLRITKGFRMSKRRLIKVAKEASLHAGQYAYAGRRDRKSNFRRLWINRISQQTRLLGIPYSKFINNLKKSKIIIDRKILSDMIVSDFEAFKRIVDKSQKV